MLNRGTELDIKGSLSTYNSPKHLNTKLSDSHNTSMHKLIIRN